MLLGLDSTDSVHGGCTTHVALEVWRSLSRFGVRGGPRLVRLNPNVPYKTRGNGALCLEIGHGVGRKRLAAVVRGRELYAYATLEEPTTAEQAEIFATASDTVDRLRAPSSNTGLVASPGQPDESFYVRAVTRHVDAPPLPQLAGVRAWGNGRGVLGARAAAAWRPRRGSYEVITYREPHRWGTKRRLALETGALLDRQAPHSFDNWDPQHRHLRIMPASPCPILAGIRGTDPHELVRCLPVLEEEPIDSWGLFVTNQASGDHLVPRVLRDIRPFDSFAAEARVAAPSRPSRGGHVFVPIEQDGTSATLAAYEPTKEFRTVLRQLDAGDVIALEASVHLDTTTLAAEAVEVLDPGPRRTSIAACQCGANAPSKGRRSQPVCPACGARVVPHPIERAGPSPGRKTVPIAVRRHLATPPGFTWERLALAAGGIAA